MILLEVFIPFEAGKKKSDTHPPTEANFPHLTIRLIACEAWWAWQKKNTPSKSAAFYMPFSFLPKIHQIVSGIFVGPKNLERCSNKHDSFPAKNQYTNSETYI